MPDLTVRQKLTALSSLMDGFLEAGITESEFIDLYIEVAVKLYEEDEENIRGRGDIL